MFKTLKYIHQSHLCVNLIHTVVGVSVAYELLILLAFYTLFILLLLLLYCVDWPVSYEYVF